MDSCPLPDSPSAKRTRRPHVAGVFLAASLNGVGEALEPREEPPIIEDLDLFDTTRLDWMAIDLDPHDPRASIVVIRTWMLQ